MGVTVEVIFWGLIGLAPDQEPPSEMFALLADPVAAHDAEEHSIPEHAARVWLIEGKCIEGHCTRAPRHVIDAASRAGLPHPLKLMGSDEDFPLRWWLHEEHLQFMGGATGGVNPVRGGRPTLLGRPVRLPETDLASRDLSWIPSVSLLTAGAGEVEADCLREAEDCPISARFLVQGGEVIACHLLHGKFSQLELFKFWAPGAPASDFHQAVADAARAQFEIAGDRIVLESWNLPRETRTAHAVLMPATRNGRITLLVGNWQSPYEKEQSHPERHFLSFYNLLGKNVVRRPVRRHTFRTDRGSTGLCEQDLESFEEKLEKAWKSFPREVRERLGPRVIPHISTECDMAQMEPPEEE